MKFAEDGCKKQTGRDEGPLSLYNLFTISSRENIAKIWNHRYHRAHHRRIADSHKSITPTEGLLPQQAQTHRIN